MGRVIAVVVAISLLLTACGPGGEPDGRRPGAEPVAHLTDDEAARLARAVNAFGFGLFGELGGAAGENVLTSPISVSVLIGMLLGGAAGDTHQAIAETIHLDEAELDESSYAALLRALGSGDEDVTLRVANSLWAMEGVTFEEDYLSFAREVFEAVSEELDLSSDAAVERIDGWVVEHTEGLIEDIAGDLGLPNPQAVLVLLNAVYFFGPWHVPFDPDITREGSFTRSDGSEVQAQLMTHPRIEVPHYRADTFEVLRLPYGEEGRFGMEIFLPDRDSSLAELAGGLDADEWRGAVEQLEERELSVVLPRFDLSYEAALDDALDELGMGIAYTPASDFSRMSPAAAWLSTVVHKARVKVDEEGTEAAAVTGGAMIVSAPPSFEADRPFLFTISDAETGTILFLGTVTDPTR